jgi:hypothetical protein
VTAEPKSITLTFDHQISEAGFDDLTALLDFQFGEGLEGGCPFSTQVCFLCSLHFGVTFFDQRFIAPCILGLPLFSYDVFFLAHYVLGLPLFLLEVFFLSPIRFGVASFFIGCLFS